MIWACAFVELNKVRGKLDPKDYEWCDFQPPYLRLEKEAGSCIRKRKYFVNFTLTPIIPGSVHSEGTDIPRHWCYGKDGHIPRTGRQGF